MLLSLSPISLVPFTGLQRLDEQIFLSQLNCRAVLLNAGFQSAVTDVVKSHLAPGFAAGHALDRIQKAVYRLERTASHGSGERLHSRGFERLPSLQAPHRAPSKQGLQARQGETAVLADLTMLSGRVGMREVSMNER